MTITTLSYIIMGVGAGFCVAAALGAKFLLPSPKESTNKEQDSEQSKQSDVVNLIEPMSFELDIRPVNAGAGSNVSTPSPAPEEVRDQAIAVARWWRTINVTPGEDWEKAMQNWDEAVKESIAALAALRMAQKTLDLDTPRIDYRQFIDRSRPEDIEDIFRSSRHRASLA